MINEKRQKWTRGKHEPNPNKQKTSNKQTLFYRIFIIIFTKSFYRFFFSRIVLIPFPFVFVFMLFSWYHSEDLQLYANFFPALRTKKLRNIPRALRAKMQFFLRASRKKKHFSREEVNIFSVLRAKKIIQAKHD